MSSSRKSKRKKDLSELVVELRKKRAELSRRIRRAIPDYVQDDGFLQRCNSSFQEFVRYVPEVYPPEVLQEVYGDTSTIENAAENYQESLGELFTSKRLKEIEQPEFLKQLQTLVEQFNTQLTGA